MDTGLRLRCGRLELGGRAVPECRVPAGAIVEHVDPFKDVPFDFSSPFVRPAHTVEGMIFSLQRKRAMREC
jgi:hypothetical protein